MKLEEKGPIMPPPVLSAWPQHTSATVQGWPGVISATHWDLYDNNRVDGADFYVGEEELGHIHLDGSVHLPVVKELYTSLVTNGFARRADFGGLYWLQFKIQSERDATHAIWLFRLNYDRLVGYRLSNLAQRIATYRLP